MANPVYGQVAPQNIHQGPGNLWFNVAVPGSSGPLAAPSLSSTAGGTLTATTYYAKVTYVYANGTESAGSPESNLAVIADDVLNIASPPAVAGATGWNAYVSNTAEGGSGAETRQNTTPIAIGTAWVEPTSGLITTNPGPLPSRLLIDINGTPLSGSVWYANQLWLVGQQIIDSNGNTQRAITTGTSGATAPTWLTTVGGITDDGTVIWQLITLGAVYYGGAVEGAVTNMFGAKTEPITADQIVGPIDSVITGAQAEIEVDMKETDIAKIAQYFAGGIYNAGNDLGLPAGAQAFQELSHGGLIAVPKLSMAVISPRRNYGGKFVVAQLYSCYQAQQISMPVSKEKTSTIKMKFTGLFIPARPQGDQAGKIYWQV
ncbi:MAG: hypothetical protein WBA09_22350 [Candidatus Acidiferrum sp.]